MTVERRIRALHLTAPEERWIGRGAFLVEDALRTAALPWADAGRLLLVRAVDLGTIPTGAAPSTVALALERRLREVTCSAVHAGQPAARQAAAVWFRDAAEAHALLAVRLARGEETAAWFWPLAVPAWQPEMPRGAALRAVLLGALETPAGPAAVLEVVRALWEVGKVDLLASALSPEDGARLVKAIGTSRPIGPLLDRILATAAETPHGASPMRRPSAPWPNGEGSSAPAASPAFGRGEVVGRPALGPHPPAPSPISHPSPGRGGDLSSEAELPRSGEDGAWAPWPEMPGTDIGSSAPRPSPSQRRDAPWGVSEAAPSVQEPQPVPGRPASSSSSSSDLTASPQTPALAPPGTAGVPPASSRKRAEEAVEMSRPIGGLADPTALAAAETPHGASLHWGGTRGDRPASAAWNETAVADAATPPRFEPRGNEWPSIPDGGALPQPPSVSQRQPFPSPRFQPGAEPGTSIGADPSPHAGLFFLLPVLAHTGLPAFLEQYPHLQDAGFPARFLDHMARRLGASSDDPVRQALLVEDVEIEGEAALFRTWRIAVRRWCRLRARIGLFDLICRPGLVMATRTHIDLFFDPRLVEMRVRRCGLDLDPGWVPWLGQVVLFHYEQPPEILDVR